ncbi:flagellar assembly protein FliH [Alcaligenaceae bacterium]|nr:flagellar assembly protein FliH [Alcaligenaceae bacterium]
MSDEFDSLYDAGGRWRRWEMESFDPAPAPPPPAAGPAAEAVAALPDPADVLAEIQRLREAAQNRGHAEGYAAGHAQGHEAGLREGREQGRQEGHDAGYAAGHAEGLEMARQEAERLHQITQACAQSIGDIEAATGDALVSLALSVAEQVLRSALNTEPERILDLIRDVVHVDGSHQGLLRLRLNPADVDMVERYLQQDATVAQWRLQADPAIERGGCVVETALGNIDATLQTRWQRVVSTLGGKA